jgi:hypothetical protein
VAGPVSASRSSCSAITSRMRSIFSTTLGRVARRPPIEFRPAAEIVRMGHSGDVLMTLGRPHQPIGSCRRPSLSTGRPSPGRWTARKNFAIGRQKMGQPHKKRADPRLRGKRRQSPAFAAEGCQQRRRSACIPRSRCIVADLSRRRRSPVTVRLLGEYRRAARRRLRHEAGNVLDREQGALTLTACISVRLRNHARRLHERPGSRGVLANMTPDNQVNSQPHVNTQTQEENVNVYQ